MLVPDRVRVPEPVLLRLPAPVMLRPVIDQSWDYALTMQFANVADHDAYQVEPQHQVFVDSFKDRWARVLVMDLA